MGGTSVRRFIFVWLQADRALLNGGDVDVGDEQGYQRAKLVSAEEVTLLKSLERQVSPQRPSQPPHPLRFSHPFFSH